MSGPNFHDIDAFFDCANAVYRTSSGTLVAVRHLGFDGWRLEQCAWVDDDDDGSGKWVIDTETTFRVTRDCVTYLRGIGANRVRSVFDY